MEITIGAGEVARVVQHASARAMRLGHVEAVFEPAQTETTGLAQLATGWSSILSRVSEYP
jgi:hypothetical protein